MFSPLYHTFITLQVIDLFMARQPNRAKEATTPRESFEKAVARVKSQIEIHNDIMRASMETALRLQEGRGNFVLYAF